MLANCDGTFYAVGRRCGHMNAPLDQGSLAGFVLTCPLHFGQFDVRDGAVLAYPLDRHFGDEPLPAAAQRALDVEARLQRKIRVDGLRTWPVRRDRRVRSKSTSKRSRVGATARRPPRRRRSGLGEAADGLRANKQQGGIDGL